MKAKRRPARTRYQWYMARLMRSQKEAKDLAQVYRNDFGMAGSIAIRLPITRRSTKGKAK